MKKHTNFITVVVLIIANTGATTAQVLSKSNTPIDVVKKVADKLIRTTPFEYQLEPQKMSTAFNGIKTINLGRQYSSEEKGIAYSLSSILSLNDTSIIFQLSHADGTKVWINKQLVYNKAGDRPSLVKYKERAIDLEFEFTASLRKGSNEILIKSETGQADACFYIRPKNSIKGLKLSLEEMPLVSKSISSFSNWLIIGPFPNPIENGKRIGLDFIYEPETEFKTGKVYEGNGHQITWTIPKVELWASGFGSSMAWGDNNFSWNYHASGSAWGVGELGAYTKEKKYADYALSYCDFFLDKKEYLAYQKYKLAGLDYGDNRYYESRMLDFTGAPALAYLFHLNYKKDLPRRKEYETFINATKNYVVTQQVRLPEGNFTRTTPHRYTTWVDDMFMGIPFLVHTSRFEKEPTEKKKLMDDAVNQIFAFNKQVWDAEKNLYHQTQYADRKINVPFWSRGNGWGLWGVSEVLLYLPKNHPKYKSVLNHYKKLVDALVQLQNKDTGFWHNLLDKPDSYQETSGTAIFTMCIARGINNGWLNKNQYESYVIKGWKAIESVVEDDGTLHGTCVGTNMSEDLQHYYTRPTADNDTHGILPVLFAGIEVHKMLNNK